MPIDKLKKIVKQLRGPNGCPWDREQTMQSITPHIIEEAYELVDSIQKKDATKIKDELGDVLLHVTMLSQMAEENGLFSLDDVATSVHDKMVRRHPHVFGDQKVTSVQEVWNTWESVKKTETTDRCFDSIPPALPALLQAYKVQKKAARAGFDWPDITSTFDKLEEEIQEVKSELTATPPNPDRLDDEIGDLLFSFVNVIRKLNISPEETLRAATQKFVKRYYLMEDLSDTPIDQLSLDQMTVLWDHAKKKNTD